MIDRIMTVCCGVVILHGIACADTATVIVDAAAVDSSRPAASARSGGAARILKNGVTVRCDVPRSGEYQLWISYSCRNGGAVLVAEVARKSLRQPIQQTSQRTQWFRSCMGTVSIPGSGLTTVKIKVDGAANRFRFHRLELIESPVLNPQLKPLLKSTIGFYDKLLRTDGGLYRNVHLVRLPGKSRSRQSEVCSIAAVGIGLMTLCMSEELGLDPAAEQKALQTLRVLNGRHPSVRPERDRSGFFRHFFSTDTGRGKSEFSTIDTAIAVVGALYCRNTFKDPRVSREADELWNSIDWSVTRVADDDLQYYMSVRDGVPEPKSKTHLFNEYYILAWLVRQHEMRGRDSADRLMPTLPSWPRGDVTLLSAKRPRPQCSFIIQFPFYMSHPGASDPLLFSYAAAQARADQQTCFERTGVEHYWGCGAGGTPDSGYVASNYAKNPDNIVSPAIISGFMPVYPQAQDHLLRIYQHPARRLRTAAGDLLPRFSVDNPDWRHHRIESIDYSSMLFGLAGIHPRLGMSFFRSRTEMTFKQQRSRQAHIRSSRGVKQ